MKNYSSIIMASLLVVGSLWSCSNNEGTRPGIYDDVVTFEASANPATRVTGVTWDAGDAIGIYMDGTETADNKQYTTSGGTTASFSPANLGTDGIKFPETGAADFYAYYPYTSSSANMEVPVNVSDQTKNLDLMYAAALGVPNADTPVALTFDRKMVKLTFNLVDEAGVGLTGIAATLKGLNTTATLDLSDGNIGNEGTVANITAVTESATASAATITAIVIPTASTTGFSVNFKNGNVDIDYDFPDGTNLDAANNYTYKVTFTAEGQISVSSSINPWDDKDGGDIDLNVGEGGGSDPGPGPNPGDGDYYSTGTLASWNFETLAATLGWENNGSNYNNSGDIPNNGASDMITGKANIAPQGNTTDGMNFCYTGTGGGAIIVRGMESTNLEGSGWLFTIPLDKEIQSGTSVSITFSCQISGTSPAEYVCEVSDDKAIWNVIGQFDMTAASSMVSQTPGSYTFTGDVDSSELFVRVRPRSTVTISGTTFGTGGTFRIVAPAISLQ